MLLLVVFELSILVFELSIPELLVVSPKRSLNNESSIPELLVASLKILSNNELDVVGLSFVIVSTTIDVFVELGADNIGIFTVVGLDQYDIPPPGPDVIVVGVVTTVIGVLVTRTNPKYER